MLFNLFSLRLGKSAIYKMQYLRDFNSKSIDNCSMTAKVFIQFLFGDPQHLLNRLYEEKIRLGSFFFLIFCAKGYWQNILFQSLLSDIFRRSLFLNVHFHSIINSFKSILINFNSLFYRSTIAVSNITKSKLHSRNCGQNNLVSYPTRFSSIYDFKKLRKLDKLGKKTSIKLDRCRIYSVN